MFGPLIFILFSFQLVLATELCKEKEWFNDLIGKCEKCKVCPAKAWELAPCLEFSNTMCVNLIEIGRSIKMNPKSESSINNFKFHHKWHEMEGESDDSPNIMVNRYSNEKPFLSKSNFEDSDNLWKQIVCIALGLTMISFAVFFILLALKYCRKISNACENRNTVTRSRLFSRDRLNTTEYMNNLATLDRRLAIDEILEKRKRAIFEPQLLNENLYTDDVFVDISGIPRNLREDHPYEELDHRKCLLQMKDRQ